MAQRGPSLQSKRLLSVLLICILLSVAGATATVMAAGYDISVPGATDVPTETVDAPDELAYDEYEVDALAVIEPGTELTADITVPDDTDVENTDVQLRNSDRGIETVESPESGGQVTFPADQTEELDPGTYSLLLLDGVTEAIHPVVISGYDIDVTNRNSADENEEITIEASVTPTESEVDSEPSLVNATIWNDDHQRSFEMSADENSDDAYTTDVSLDNFEPGEYEVYVTAHGDEEFQDEKEVLGLGEGSSLDIEEVEDGTDDSTDDTDDGTNGGGDSSGTSGGGAAGGGEISPVASESRSIEDDTPSEPGMTVQLNEGAVNSVTFSEGQEGGSIDVEEYDGTPPGAPDTGDRPVMEGVVITPSEEYRNTAATIEITVDQTEVLRADATAEDLAVLKATDTGYQTLDTDVVADNGDVTLAAETPGFSTFIVSTNEGDIDTSGDGDTATSGGDDTGSTETAESGSSSDDVMQPSNGTESEPAEPEGQVGFGIIVSVLSLLLVTLLAKHRHRA